MPKRRRPPPGPLDAALSYENLEVLSRFRRHYRVSQRQANELFVETKRWLWLLALALSEGREKELVIDERMFAVDEMWHTFVVFTEPYADFCERYLGGFVHHHPTTDAERAAARVFQRKHPERALAQYEAGARRMMDFIASNAGPDTVRRWYLQFPKRYPLAYFAARRLFPGGD